MAFNRLARPITARRWCTNKPPAPLEPRRLYHNGSKRARAVQWLDAYGCSGPELTLIASEAGVWQNLQVLKLLSFQTRPGFGFNFNTTNVRDESQVTPQGRLTQSGNSDCDWQRLNRSESGRNNRDGVLAQGTASDAGLPGRIPGPDAVIEC